MTKHQKFADLSIEVKIILGVFLLAWIASGLFEEILGSKPNKGR